MGEGECWGGGGDEGWGWGGGVKVQKYSSVIQHAAAERFFSEPRIFFVDDDSGLSATGSVR